MKNARIKKHDLSVLPLFCCPLNKKKNSGLNCEGTRKWSLELEHPSQKLINCTGLLRSAELIES